MKPALAGLGMTISWSWILAGYLMAYFILAAGGFGLVKSAEDSYIFSRRNMAKVFGGIVLIVASIIVAVHACLILMRPLLP